MQEQKHSEANDVQEDMEVETAKGDLGKEDVSKPKVKRVIRGPDGNVEWRSSVLTQSNCASGPMSYRAYWLLFWSSS
jgi:hypothetical protein